MTKLLEIREALFALYEKANNIIKHVFKFMFYLAAFLYISNYIGYNESFQKLYMVIGFSLLASFVPRTIALILLLFYTLVHIYPTSVILAGTVLAFAIIFMCFFGRYLAKYNYVIIAMPLLITLKLPFLLPISLGLFFTPETIIPMSIGVFLYYLISGINKNAVIIEGLDGADNQFSLFRSVLDVLFKDKSMLITIVVLSIVIITVYIIKNLKIDYSYFVAAFMGSLVSMVGYLLASLKCDMGMNLFFIVLFSMLSAFLAGAAVYFYRPISYYYVENVTFEDDDYIYFVRAVPKVKVAGSKVSLKNFSLEAFNDETKEEEEKSKEIEE